MSTALGPCTVTGHVLDVAGQPLGDVAVDLSYVDEYDNYGYAGRVYTDASGGFVFTGVPESSNGWIDAYADENHAYQSWGNVFTASGPNDFTLRPGLTGVEALRTSDPSWNWWQWLRIETWGSRGGGTTWINGESGEAIVMPPDYDYAVAYPYDNQGIEWNTWSPLPVTPGESDGNTMTFDQADGRGAWILSPYWQSGKPGTVMKLVLENWPAGYQMSFYGYSQAPSGVFKDWPYYLESDGSMYGTARLTIPATAPAGYDYELHVYRYDDDASGLDLTAYFQVASLVPSRTVVSPGGAVRLRGTIPTEGHMGAQAGKVKYVTLYRRTTSAGPPTTWDATLKGWRKVAVLRANGYGKYVSAYLHPRRTTWYVVRYPGDNWYFRAYTSVVKVRVR